MSETQIDFEKGNGLIPAVVQDSETGEILMLAFQNKEAFEKTVETREAHFWSRSRQELWKKGKTSGNVFKVAEILTDCDNDSVILKVEHDKDLKACHTGEKSCFFKKIV